MMFDAKSKIILAISIPAIVVGLYTLFQQGEGVQTFLGMGKERKTAALYRSGSRDIIALRSSVVNDLYPHAHLPGDSETDHATMVTDYYTVPEDLWYLSSSPGEILNAPLEVLHHAEVKLADEKEVEECDNEPSVTAASPEMIFNGRSHSPPPRTAQFFKKGTRLVFRTYYHNPGPKIYHDVSFLLKLHVSYEEEIPEGTRELKFFYRWLSNTPCQGYFTVPPLERRFRIASSNSNPFSYIVFPEDGEIINMRAHIHFPDGGKTITAYLNGESVYTFRPVETVPYNKLGWINTYVAAEPIRVVKKGDRLTFDAMYNNSSGRAVLDGMGRIYVYFLPKSGIAPTQ